MITRKKFLAVSLILSLVLTASAVSAKSKSKREVMQMVEKCIADYFNDDYTRKEYKSEITRNNDGSYTLNHDKMTMRFMMERKGRPDKNGKYPLYLTLHGGGGTAT